jgi:hypothetical protein
MYTVNIPGEWLLGVLSGLAGLAFVIGLITFIVRSARKSKRQASEQAEQKRKEKVAKREKALGDWEDLYQKLFVGRNYYYAGSIEALRKFSVDHPPNTVTPLSPAGLNYLLDCFENSSSETIRQAAAILGPYVETNLTGSKMCLPPGVRAFRGISISDDKRHLTHELLANADFVCSPNAIIKNRYGKTGELHDHAEIEALRILNEDREKLITEKNQQLENLRSELAHVNSLPVSRPPITWTDREGRTRAITDMTTGHLRNAMAYLDRKFGSLIYPYKGQPFERVPTEQLMKYAAMKEELERRNDKRQASYHGGTAQQMPCCPECGQEGVLQQLTKHHEFEKMGWFAFKCENADCDREAAFFAESDPLFLTAPVCPTCKKKENTKSTIDGVVVCKRCDPVAYDKVIGVIPKDEGGTTEDPVREVIEIF